MSYFRQENTILMPVGHVGTYRAQAPLLLAEKPGLRHNAIYM